MLAGRCMGSDGLDHRQIVFNVDYHHSGFGRVGTRGCGWSLPAGLITSHNSHYQTLFTTIVRIEVILVFFVLKSLLSGNY